MANKTSDRIRGPGRPADPTLQNNPMVQLDIRRCTRQELQALKRAWKVGTGQAATYDLLIKTMLLLCGNNTNERLRRLSISQPKGEISSGTTIY